MPAARLSALAAEVLHSGTTDARVSQVVAEVLMSYTAPSAPAISGARISQAVAEVLHQVAAPDARVSQFVVEILFSSAGAYEGGAISGGAGTTSYGFAV
jgi:hypothetical protein